MTYFASYSRQEQIMHRKAFQNLVAWKGQKKRKPLLLKGVRQVGKTYLMKKFGQEHFQRSHYLNFEDDEEIAAIFEKNLNPQRILSEIEFYLNTKIDINKDLLIFDEIQECPKALTSLKYFQEKMEKLALFAAGSLLGIHLNSGSFPVGKVDMMTLYPMSFIEFLMAIQDQRAIDFLSENNAHLSTIPEIIHQHLWERLKWYFIVGGLPEPVEMFRQKQENLFEAFEASRSKQRELIQGYLADMAKHSGKVNAMHIERVWRNVPAQLAKTQDGSARRFRFTKVVPGIDRYSRLVGAIDWLEAAGLVLKVHVADSGLMPFAAYTEDSFFKLLVCDIGLLGAMTDLVPKTILDYEYGSYKGYFAENFVAQEFLCSGESALYGWQEGRSEVEFLRVIQGSVVPIEVKSGWVTRSKSLAKFLEKCQPKRSVILSANPPSKRGAVELIPLYLAGSLNLPD